MSLAVKCKIMVIYFFQVVFDGYRSLQQCLRDQYNIDALCLYVHGKPYVRLSAYVFNHIDDYQKLADAVLHLKHQ